jgi:uncharacterized NAD-dependent epimerase/dehydratase family protein
VLSSQKSRRYAVLTEGLLLDRCGKTAHGLIRFRSAEVVAVIDSAYAGKTVRDVLPWLGSTAPIVASVTEALAYEPSSLLVGVATDGGRIPPALRGPILEAVDAGLEIVSGLHEFLQDDSEIVARAASSGSSLWDVRIPPQDIPVFSGAVYNAPQQVVLAVGTDCAVGKMTAMLEVERAARELGARIQFLATGQTGILIADNGIPIDSIVSDFVTGAAEQLVLGAPPSTDVLLVEGQGSILHPAYAPVTYGLLYGSAPDALVLCHRANQTHIDGFDVNLPPLAELVDLHEQLLGYIKPARVAAIVLDTAALTPMEAAEAIVRAAQETGLPADDPVRNGGTKIWRAMENELKRTRKALKTPLAHVPQR